MHTNATRNLSRRARRGDLRSSVDVKPNLGDSKIYHFGGRAFRTVMHAFYNSQAQSVSFDLVVATIPTLQMVKMSIPVPLY